MKTVKELSETIGVSKVSIYKAINFKLKDKLKDHVFKNKDKSTAVDEIGEVILKNYFCREIDKTLKNISDDFINEDKEPITDNKLNSKLKNEVKNTDIITVLQEQLCEKDNQIKSLLDIVSNQQKLHATQLISHNNTNINDTNYKPKTNFFTKFFKK